MVVLPEHFFTPCDPGKRGCPGRAPNAPYVTESKPAAQRCGFRLDSASGSALNRLLLMPN
jgi:hypothetical protein